MVGLQRTASAAQVPRSHAEEPQAAPVRLRLRQAFGRLIRRTSDRGVFVLLDRQTPSRLLSAFPAGVAIRRVGLAEAVKQTCAFLGESLPA